jgi:4-hydroxybenzoate polyprenyltransferase
MNRLLAYLQLLRLPNVFTAMADVCMGFLISHGSLARWTEFVPLLVASSCIYLAGMALNDWFDVELDRRERPQRPLPSGRVPVSHASFIGAGLLVVGVACAAVASAVSRSVASINVALLLVVSVLAYDGLLKSTFLGPLVMGLCRALNVLLGMSSVPGAIWLFGAEGEQSRLGTMAAAALGLYVMGVTRFASREATPGARLDLTSTTIGFNLGLLLMAMVPQFSRGWLAVHGIDPAGSPEIRYYAAAAIWGVVALVTNVMVWRAIAENQPATIQQAVKTCIVAIIGLDAAVVALINGPIWAGGVLLLLVPTLTLGRWVYST